MDRSGETEAELVERRSRESAARAASHDARIEAHRLAGTLLDGGTPAIGYGLGDDRGVRQG